MFRILNKLQQGNKRSSGTYGEVAQLARARGSYPRCRGFKSPPRYLNEEIRNVGCPAFLFFCVWEIRKHMPGGFSVRRKQYFCVMVGKTIHYTCSGNIVKEITLGGVKG